MTPDTAMDSAHRDQGINTTLFANAVAAEIDKVYSLTGKNSILVSHSQGGFPGWEAPRYTDHIASIIAIEPGGAPYIKSDNYNVLVQKIIPIVFYYGDYIVQNYLNIPAAGMWDFMRLSAYTFQESSRSAGLTCMVYDLLNEGIYGNDHMMFQDLNNDVIAAHIEDCIINNVGSLYSNSRFIALTRFSFYLLFLFV